MGAGFKHLPSFAEAKLFYMCRSKPASGSCERGDEPNYTKSFNEIQIYTMWPVFIQLNDTCKGSKKKKRQCQVPVQLWQHLC